MWLFFLTNGWSFVLPTRWYTRLHGPHPYSDIRFISSPPSSNKAAFSCLLALYVRSVLCALCRFTLSCPLSVCLSACPSACLFFWRHCCLSEWLGDRSRSEWPAACWVFLKGRWFWEARVTFPDHLRHHEEDPISNTGKLWALSSMWEPCHSSQLLS